ncbi:hypothetical protein RIF29_30015 [Crotalaria pallida]|uniref:Uncharacterized protein n=1 Tax=Crotalaria pallida TaxID=3830 RepID=A0AAN9EHW8_CROPI
MVRIGEREGSAPVKDEKDGPIQEKKAQVKLQWTPRLQHRKKRTGGIRSRSTTIGEQDFDRLRRMQDSCHVEGPCSLYDDGGEQAFNRLRRREYEFHGPRSKCSSTSLLKWTRA